MKLYQNIICLLMLLTLTSFTPAPSQSVYQVVDESQHFTLEAFEGDDNKPNERQIESTLEMAESALTSINKNLPLELSRKIKLRWCPTTAAFSRMTNGQSESTLGAARGQEGLIFLNGEALRAEHALTAEKVLRHEYAHVYLAQTIPGGIPLWMNEGLAMHIAGEWSFWDSVALRKAHALGRLLPLNELRHSFPTSPHARRLAYLEGRSVVDFLIQTRTSDKTAAAFIRQLQRPGPGQINADEYFSTFITASIESSWKSWLGGRIVSFITVVGSSGFFWFAVALLFITAWWTKKSRAAKKMAEWDDEERIYEVLDEAEGPPGDPEDYLPEKTAYEEAYEEDEW